MRELQNVGRQAKKNQIVIIIIVVVLLISFIGILIFNRFIKDKDVETIKLAPNENMQSQDTIQTKEITTTAVETKAVLKDEVMVILITLEDGDVYAYTNSDTKHSDLYYFDSNTPGDLFSKGGDVSVSLLYGQLIEPEMVDIKEGMAQISLSDITLSFEASETNVFLKRLGAVINNKTYYLSPKWKEQYEKLNNKKEQLDSTAGVDLIELPDTYPASFSHANIAIYSVDKETFVDYDKATDFARTNLPAMAKEHNISGYFIGEGLLNNGNIRYLIYWIK